MARAFGAYPAILLHGMGGLCVYDAERQGPGQRLAVLFAGPGAGFLLAGLVFAGRMALGDSPLSPTGELIYDFLLEINIVWGILNLFPIWPLDGGQIVGVILTVWNRRRGMRWTHIISVVTCGLLVLAAFRFGQVYLAILFALFAFQNIQMLQSYQYAGYGGDDADWWKR
jgi:Zn-dependent protease